MPQVANQGVPQGGLALAGTVPGEQIIDQLVDSEPVDPPRREDRAKLAAGGLLQGVNDEQPIEIVASEICTALLKCSWRSIEKWAFCAFGIQRPSPRAATSARRRFAKSRPAELCSSFVSMIARVIGVPSGSCQGIPSGRIATRSISELP